MGGSYSQEELEKVAFGIFRTAVLTEPCLLPDIGLDESLLKYSGPDSNDVLQAYSDQMLKKVPGYIASFGSVLGSLKSVPNAVGLGALVISMIIEINIQSNTSDDDTYSLLRRVFGEEKASSVRDTMAEYLKRHRMFMNNNQQLRREIVRLEQQLSNHLTVLRNSLLKDGQMSSRGFKIWVNGAAFHVQMLIHESRLAVQAGKPASDCVTEIEAAINEYSRHLDHLLEKYKTYKINSDAFVNYYWWSLFHEDLDVSICKMVHTEIKECWISMDGDSLCSYGKELMTAFMDIVYSRYPPITNLKKYFLYVKSRLYFRILDRGSFTVPSAV